MVGTVSDFTRLIFAFLAMKVVHTDWTDWVILAPWMQLWMKAGRLEPQGFASHRLRESKGGVNSATQVDSTCVSMAL